MEMPDQHDPQRLELGPVATFSFRPEVKIRLQITGGLMKVRSLVMASIAVALVTAFSVPAYAGPSKEMIELQSQVQQLLKVQQSIDEKMGVLQDRMNSLTQQVNENLKNLSASADKLDKALHKQEAINDTCVDQVTGQTQPLHDALTELRAQLAAMSKQLNEMSGVRQDTQSPAKTQEGQAPNPR
jgi:septal ring factor EnvC (AmiA/AmiB activator)